MKSKLSTIPIHFLGGGGGGGRCIILHYKWDKGENGYSLAFLVCSKTADNKHNLLQYEAF